jgi:SNF2 family DNA or RNA helicase
LFPIEVYEKMYPHQREGIKWLWERHLDESIPGGILGDDMGSVKNTHIHQPVLACSDRLFSFSFSFSLFRLGKTIQIVTFLRGLFVAGEVRHVLIVMPLALLENWKREFETWYPDMRVKIIHGNGPKKFKDLETVQKKGGVCLTTYGYFPLFAPKKRIDFLVLFPLSLFFFFFTDRAGEVKSREADDEWPALLELHHFR